MTSSPKALVALSAVLLVSVVLWLALIGQAALHMSQAFSGVSSQQGQVTVQLGWGCLELGLRGIVLDQDYAGENLSWGDQSCIINLSRSGNNYALAIAVESGTYSKRFNAQAVMNNGRLTLNNWQEIQ